jgi:S1-C subfamily serine protease
MLRALPLLIALSLAAPAIGCGGGRPADAADASKKKKPSASRQVFEAVSQSVVAILNDDKDDREAEIQELEKAAGEQRQAPKKIVEVSSRTKPMPHGTGFMIPGDRIVTAAHVVSRPDKLKMTTRGGQTVDAVVERIDEVRDIAVLKPKGALQGVPPIELATEEVSVGEEVWAMGHTGQGLWELAWGLSEGVASGHVNLLGARLLLFDAAVYPGFSGGPVVMRDKGKARIVGVNHAILFTGQMLFTPLASISSATAVSDLNEVLAGHPPRIQPALAEYAKTARSKVRAALFVTDDLNVHREPNGHQTADIRDDRKRIPVRGGRALVPITAMLFSLPAGRQELVFELKDPSGATVSTVSKALRVTKRQRVSFASATLDATPKMGGAHVILVRLGGTTIGDTRIQLDVPGSDDEPSDDEDEGADQRDDPTVDVVVATLGVPEPLRLSGVRASWDPRSFPRRVDGFTWFARGSRGWSGRDVVISAYVLDDKGRIVGRSMGCYQPELRPERSWSCLGSGGGPLLMKPGAYDIVFTLNERPVAMWPMDAAVKLDKPPRPTRPFGVPLKPSAAPSARPKP